MCTPPRISPGCQAEERRDAMLEMDETTGERPSP